MGGGQFDITGKGVCMCARLTDSYSYGVCRGSHVYTFMTSVISRTRMMDTGHLGQGTKSKFALVSYSFHGYGPLLGLYSLQWTLVHKRLKL